MRKSYNRPKNDQDFEKLCLRLLRAHWKCPELQQYATRGQAQHGVDIIDLSGQEPLRAAQCKSHEEGKMTTPDEVGDEGEKAKGFKPPLGRYAIMTTGKVGKEVHDLLLAINQEHVEKNLFIVEIFGDILRIFSTSTQASATGTKAVRQRPSPEELSRRLTICLRKLSNSPHRVAATTARTNSTSKLMRHETI